MSHSRIVDRLAFRNGIDTADGRAARQCRDVAGMCRVALFFVNQQGEMDFCQSLWPGHTFEECVALLEQYAWDVSRAANQALALASDTETPLPRPASPIPDAYTLSVRALDACEEVMFQTCA